MKILSFLTLLTALCVLDTTEASVFAKSTKTECIVQSGEGTDLKTKDGNPCKQKLVVALTVTSNDVSHNVKLSASSLWFKFTTILTG